jgi:hypothetical protein
MASTNAFYHRPQVVDASKLMSGFDPAHQEPTLAQFEDMLKLKRTLLFPRVDAVKFLKSASCGRLVRMCARTIEDPTVYIIILSRNERVRICEREKADFKNTFPRSLLFALDPITNIARNASGVTSMLHLRESKNAPSPPTSLNPLSIMVTAANAIASETEVPAETMVVEEVPDEIDEIDDDDDPSVGDEKPGTVAVVPSTVAIQDQLKQLPREVLCKILVEEQRRREVAEMNEMVKRADERVRMLEEKVFKLEEALESSNRSCIAQAKFCNVVFKALCDMTEEEDTVVVEVNKRSRLNL